MELAIFHNFWRPIVTDYWVAGEGAIPLPLQNKDFIARA